MPAVPATRTVVITGAASGIGRASAVRLAEPGTLVLALDRDDDGAAQTARAVQATGGQCTAIPCDVTDEASVEAAMTATPAVDVLVNSAGIFGDKPLSDVTADDLRRMYEVNVVGLFIATKAALARMPDGGRPVGLSTT